MSLKYKMIACDLDGTLMTPDACLSRENYEAIEELTALGVLFVPATGRSFYEVPECVRTHPSIRYFISSDGAMVQDLKSKEKFCTLLDGDTTTKILKAMRRHGIISIQHKNNYSTIESALVNDAVRDKYKISPYFWNQITTCIRRIDNFDEEFLTGEPCELLSGCYYSKDQLDAFLADMNNIDGIRFTSPMNEMFDIVSSKAGKRNAILALMQRLGITEDELITVGDSNNDLEMIKLTKNSIAVANAAEELKASAAHIGCKNSEHIAKYILDRLF